MDILAPSPPGLVASALDESSPSGSANGAGGGDSSAISTADSSRATSASGRSTPDSALDHTVCVDALALSLGRD